GRLAEEARLHRERRLVARLAALPLDRVEERRLLAADVGAGAAADLDVEAEPLPQDIVAEEAAGPGLLDGALQALDRQRVLAADIDEAALAGGGAGGDGHRLEERERVLFHQDAVFEGAGLRLVGVADEIVRAHRLARHRLPFPSGREGGAAATDQLRVEDLAQDPLGAERDGPAQRRVAAVRAVVVEALGIRQSDALQEAQAGGARVESLRGGDNTGAGGGRLVGRATAGGALGCFPPGGAGHRGAARLE